MQETWNKFVYYLCEAKKNKIDENEYHSHIEFQLQLLGWDASQGEICHKPNIPNGNSGWLQPDILIKKGEENQFVIEVKRPVHTRGEKEQIQLESYMRRLKLTVGIYIGEHIEVFYDQPGNKEVVSVMKVDLEINNTKGVKFVELFSKQQFCKTDIEAFCEERIKEMQRQESLNKIRENLISEDGKILIKESLRQYLTEKYKGVFVEEEIWKMLSTLRFCTVPIEVEAQNKSNATGRCHSTRNSKPTLQMPIISQQKGIPCVLSRNGIDAKGVYYPNDNSLVVLKGSRISSVNLPNLKSTGIARREKMMAEHTEIRDGVLCVKQDVRFKKPSGAAVFCIGGSSNGWIDWKDNDNNPLSKYRK